MIISCAFPVMAVEVKPVVNAQLLGGQYFYNGSDNAFGAVASLSAAPYMQFNDRWSLVPLYSGSYKGTKQVTDLVGGGTLFQESQDHTGSLKAIRSFANGLKLKAVGAYGAEFLRETVDEKWGKGLYDNRRLSGGAESEWSWDKERYVRLAYDYYTIRFPNYASLESQGSSMGLGRELNAPDVLDNKNHALTLGGQAGLPGNGFAEAAFSQTWRRFGSQHLVDLSGDLISELRGDQIQTASLQGTWPVLLDSNLKLFTSVGYSRSRVYSNQNHYDAQKVVFNPNYYAYIQQSISNQWTLAVGEDPWTIGLNWTVSRQKYADRLTQDALGNYETGRTRVDGASIGLQFAYPIAAGFRLNALTQLGWSDSNNHNNQVYQYHYNTQTYLMGFSYAY
jgi:hypothetical protein